LARLFRKSQATIRCLFYLTKHAIQRGSLISLSLSLSLQGYVSCSWGISNIGYVLICYGVTNSGASFSTGYLVKLTGRLFMVLFATLIQIGITVTLYVWTPDPANSSVTFFVISGLWGVTDAVWLVQINGECV
jgi:hypothetical protein